MFEALTRDELYVLIDMINRASWSQPIGSPIGREMEDLYVELDSYLSEVVI